MDELNIKLGDYCVFCLNKPCDCKLDLHIVNGVDLCEGEIRHTCIHFETYVGCDGCPIKKYKHK